jgi:hypothetical protein
MTEHQTPKKYYFDFENKSPTFVDIYIKPIRTIQFSRDQSELTTQIWVALLGVDK